ncbi:sclerostin domain-containing protein 1-like [Asterias amurensis]|uniref:sclerostin domain-containing protein 1-like n=1 Tax=Asterias amurensis TaxID=7602 RepID=UPI003AB33301
MWITVRRLWLGAAILWSTVLCSTSGLVVNTDDEHSEMLPETLPDLAIVNERRQNVNGGSSIGGPIRGVDQTTETDEEAYNPEDLSCRELRSKRYISDGFCTSPKPVAEVICVGECVPNQLLEWGADFTKIWSRSKTKEWRCVNDVVRQRRVHLVCETGERRTYRISTVKSCRCKRFNKRQNESRLNNANENANVEPLTKEDRRRNRQQQKDNERSERSNRDRDK